MVVDADMLFRVLSVLVSASAFVFAWSQAKSKAGAEALNDLEVQIIALRTETIALAARLSKAEGEMQHMPDKDTVHKIELGMKDIEKTVSAQAETLRGYAEALKANTTTMQRLEEFLMTARAAPAASAAGRRK